MTPNERALLLAVAYYIRDTAPFAVDRLITAVEAEAAPPAGRGPRNAEDEEKLMQAWEAWPDRPRQDPLDEVEAVLRAGPSGMIYTTGVETIKVKTVGGGENPGKGGE